MHRDVRTGRQRLSTSLEQVIHGLTAPPTVPGERYFHTDLTDMPGDALFLEHRRMRLAVMLSLRPSSWTIERLARIEAEMEARRG